MHKRLYFLSFLTLTVCTLTCNRPQDQQLNAATEPTESPDEPRVPKYVPIESVLDQAEKVITLTEDQKLKIYQLADQYNYDLLSPQEQKQIRADLRQQVFTDILTPEQRQAVQEALRERGG